MVKCSQKPEKSPKGLDSDRRLYEEVGGMQYIITAYDGTGMLEKRMEVRPQHLENMERVKEHVVCAGGLLDEVGKMKGSALVMEFPGREELDAYLDSEPYIREHVWEKVTVESMNVVILDGKKVR